MLEIQHGRCDGLSVRELFLNSEAVSLFRLKAEEALRYGSVCSVGAGVHPGLVCAHGSGAVQRRRGESDPQKQPEFS